MALRGTCSACGRILTAENPDTTAKFIACFCGGRAKIIRTDDDNDND